MNDHPAKSAERGFNHQLPANLALLYFVMSVMVSRRERMKKHGRNALPTSNTPVHPGVWGWLSWIMYGVKFRSGLLP